MTVLAGCLEEIGDRFDVAALDQYGVLHDGTEPYPFANAALEYLKETGKPTVVLSNSGKRADINGNRIRRLGVRLDEDCVVETSGETCWRDLDTGQLAVSEGDRQAILPVEARSGDAERWADGNRHAEIVSDLGRADAVMLMGMPEPDRVDGVLSMFGEAVSRRLPLICSNPDRMSPSRTGTLPSPGTLADRFGDLGGEVIWYGKPYPKIFAAVQARFPGIDPKRILMVGDSMEHDVAGAARAGWSTAFVRCGIHRDEFPPSAGDDTVLSRLRPLAKLFGGISPDYSLPVLQ